MSIPKPSGMLCGSACSYYLLDKLYGIKIDVPFALYWMPEIGLFFHHNTAISISMSCFNSSLYYDYLHLPKPHEFEGFKFISDYEDLVGTITEEEVSAQLLDLALSQNKQIILNVSSSTFNGDSTMKGGHFICVIGQKNNRFIVVNPKASTIAIEEVSKKLVVKASNNNGNWLLALKKE